MKNKIFIFTLISFGLFCSCDMEREMITTLTKEQVNSQYNYVKGQCVALYDNLLDGSFEFGNGMQASACDEADLVNKGGVQIVNTGSWNQYNNPDEVIARYYTAIRRVNDFLHPICEVNLDAYRLDPTPSQQLIYKERLSDIKNWKFEARFLRAYFYFELIKRYGGMPILTEPLPLETEFSSIQRNTLEECVKFIVDECDSVTVDGALPVIYRDDDMGRATKGAALALKSRVLLYAASDLFNMPEAWASGYAKPELISLPIGNRKLRWKAAADAALAVINLSGSGYTLASDYSILGKTFQNHELIFLRRNNASNYFERTNFPKGLPIGNGSVNPSQNLVDAYEMKDGSKFDWSNPTHYQDPYYNRDPRLEYTILHNQSNFNNKTVLEIYTGGVNGKGVENATETGYYLRKFVDETLDLVQNRSSVHSWVLFRISEIYLNYAEALNEYNPGDPNILIYLNKPRQRKGVEMPPITEKDQILVRERIRNERRIELAFEGHRLWDVRRWMIAPTVLNEPLYGVNCEYKDYEFKYTKMEVEKRLFMSKMYFYPIPQSLLLTSGNIWSQNPLW